MLKILLKIKCTLYYIKSFLKLMENSAESRFKSSSQKSTGIFFIPCKHVVASFVSLAATFYVSQKKSSRADSVAPSFRNKLRSVCLNPAANIPTVQTPGRQQTKRGRYPGICRLSLLIT